MDSTFKFKWRQLPLLIWMSVIFILSHQSGDELKGASSWWKDLLESVFHITEHFDKVAHLGLYGILGMTASFALPKVMVNPWLICVIFGMTDEIHQIFIPGRSCDVLDLAADALGAALGCCLMRVVFESRMVGRR